MAGEMICQKKGRKMVLFYNIHEEDWTCDLPKSPKNKFKVVGAL